MVDLVAGVAGISVVAHGSSVQWLQVSYVTAASILLLNRLKPERINARTHSHTLTTADLHLQEKHTPLYVCVCVGGQDYSTVVFVVCDVSGINL